MKKKDILLNEIKKELGWTSSFEINLLDSNNGRYYIVQLDSLQCMAFSKTEPDIYSNNYIGFIEGRKQFPQTFNKLHHIIANISCHIKDYDNPLITQLKQKGFDIGEQPKNQGSTRYIIDKNTNLRVGTLNLDSDKITLFGTNSNNLEMLKAQKKLINFVLDTKNQYKF